MIFLSWKKSLIYWPQEVPAKYFDHAMVNMNWIRNCHIKKNWVLFYLKDDVSLILLCLRTGTHDDLGI